MPKIPSGILCVNFKCNNFWHIWLADDDDQFGMPRLQCNAHVVKHNTVRYVQYDNKYDDKCLSSW